MDTYQQLINDAKDRLEVYSSDVDRYMPTAVYLAEIRVAHDAGYQRIDVVGEREVTEEDQREQALVADDMYMGPSERLVYYKADLAIDPDSFLHFNNVYAKVFPNSYVKMTRVDMSFIQEFVSRQRYSGTPRYYSYEEGNPSTIYFAPTADVFDNLEDGEIMGVRFEYARRPDRLGPENQTNVLLTKVPNLLFTALISELAKYNKDAEEYAQAEADYMKLLASHTVSMDREEKDVGRVHRDPAIQTQKVNL